MIFVARILDVSIGTIRVLFISRGLKVVAPILGFVEVSIWLVAIRNILLHVDGVLGVIAYAGGFAAGTLIGMFIDDRLNVGKVMLRVITRKNRSEMVALLKSQCNKVTWTSGKGKNGKVVIIFAIVDKKRLKHIVKNIKGVNPKAFYTIEEVKYAYEEPKHRHASFGLYRKGR